jgi:hypothetical protein
VNKSTLKVDFYDFMFLSMRLRSKSSLSRIANYFSIMDNDFLLLILNLTLEVLLVYSLVCLVELRRYKYL